MKKTKRDCFSIGTGSLTKWEEGGMLKIAFIFCHMKLNTLFKNTIVCDAACACKCGQAVCVLALSPLRSASIVYIQLHI